MGVVLSAISAFISKNIKYIAIGFIVITLIIIPAITSITNFIKYYKRKNKIEILKVRIMAKRVFDPEENTYTQRSGSSKEGSDVDSRMRYYVAFETIEGKIIELALKKEVYDALEEGTRGELVIKGGECISFNWDDEKK